MTLALLKSLLTIAGGVLVGVSVLLYLMQDRLLFHPQRLTDGQLQAIRRQFPQAEEITLPVGDGVTLHGWLVKSNAARRPPLLIYFGGNAEEVSSHLGDAALYPEWSLLLMNYRGYGRSGGRPTERALLDDALLIHEAMTRRADVDPARIVVIGRSLGSGVAVHLAARRSLAGAILVTPYDSILAVARRHYPYAPVGLLLNHHFDSLAAAPAIRTPALFIAAEHDDVIPAPHARRLYEAWGGPKSWQLLPGTDHADIADHPDYAPQLSAFLASLR